MPGESCAGRFGQYLSAGRTERANYEHGVRAPGVFNASNLQFWQVVYPEHLHSFCMIYAEAGLIPYEFKLDTKDMVQTPYIESCGLLPEEQAINF